MKFFNYKIIFFILISIFFSFSFSTYAQTVNIDASKLLAHVEVSLSPRSGSFVEGSTFQVPILVNTKNRSINGIEIRINFDKNKLSIVNPTGGTSIIGVWVEPPGFDNTRGTASYVGVIPNGIITESGLIGTITFKAKVSGKAVVSIASNSKILLNDGLGTSAQLDTVRAEYNILAKAPDGVLIFSDTHPIQNNWYNNNTPIVSWQKDEGVSGFSFILDNKPNTIPDNISEGEDIIKTFDTLTDGLWYFHIKAIKNGAWGSTGHFLLRVDTNPPAEFNPETNFLTTSDSKSDRTLVSFFTTDNLSGLDHYEVGVIDKNQPATQSPVFEQAESPFQVPLTENGKLQIIVRAVDKAGNVRDQSVEAHYSSGISKFFRDYPVYILLGIILLGILLFILHFLFSHHIIRYIRRIREILKKEEVTNKNNTVIPKPEQEDVE
ncbi:MAG: cohesin domain-containing protein [Candidatus Nomurabacteria bacterium]|nr:cohesin domain-containing protein [Candidatus Nomurabacteria bacterium]